ncbi:MAG: carbohydrate ABC transporter permease [Bacilli bacterium]|jgi:multiple sugar transport system permease protein|nr:carbohydrate ABC transporter permease [Bacilli bacterium]MDD3389314.1 carbohydrate ABC transporter permease [Bacilli bacterium]MDD4344369.1 carbohydrate ABC transporter permease [Bacilli bacterium]MDD4521027.1 carbohydrate ABC transporter permease [Bacilli bacterium]MDY0399712.1 carbohydrate ABC transporter permease [Bacilli bacterium]
MANHEQYFASESDRRRWLAGFIVSRVFIYGFLTAFALFILLPFWFMIVTSLKHAGDYQNEQAQGILNLFPTTLTFKNFGTIFGAQWGYSPSIPADREIAELGLGTSGENFVIYFTNTIIVAVTSTVFMIITTVLASFAFARLEFKGKNLLFTLLLATMMVPGEMMIITNFQTANSLNWTNTYAALIFVHGISIFYIFYLRQTFQQIPNELYLAAKVDGYGEFGYLLKVMIPIAMPTIVTITILNVMGSWNAYIWPNLIATADNPIFGNSMKLVSNGLMSMFSNTFRSYDTLRIAGSMVVTAPLLVVFIFFRKYIMRGVSRSGIKG